MSEDKDKKLGRVIKRDLDKLTIQDPTKQLRENMKKLSDKLKIDPLGKTASDILKQQNRLDEWETLERIKPPQIPPNPIHETNDKLARLEELFERMLEAQRQTAQISNNLHASSAEHLSEFKQATKDNSRTARIAIFTGILAVVLAVVQIAYNEYIAGPENKATAEQIALEISELRSEQIEVLEELSTVIKNSENSSTEILNEINENLKMSLMRNNQNKQVLE